MQIEDRAFKRFNDERTLNLNLIRAESQLATARGTEKRENARLAVQNAQLAINKNKLENQVADVSLQITNIQDQMPSLGDAQKQQAEEAIKILKQRRQDLTKTIRATKTPSALSSLTAQGLIVTGKHLMKALDLGY